MAQREDWLELLEAACQEASQGMVARRLRYSSGYIGQVRKPEKRALLGDLSEVERRVLAAYGGEVVGCPVLGEIPLGECHQNQALPFAASNPQRVRLWRACRGCEHNVATPSPGFDSAQPTGEGSGRGAGQ